MNLKTIVPCFGVSDNDLAQYLIASHVMMFILFGNWTAGNLEWFSFLSLLTGSNCCSYAYDGAVV